MKNIVVFASGSGSNFQSIIASIQDGKLNACIAGLISNKERIKALDRAKEFGIPFVVLSEKEFEDYSKYELALLDQLKSWKPDLLVLAGYLKKVPPSVIQAYQNRILNIHPSLLPKYGGKGFYGLKVHAAAIEAGESVSGCTIHIVSEKYDDGPILAQTEVPVLKNDAPETLATRILKQEHKLYPKVIFNYLNNLTD